MPRLVIALARDAPSTIGKVVQKSLYATHDSGLAGCGFKRFFSHVDQGIGMKAGRQALEAQGGYLPVSVTARTAKQIDLLRKTVDKCLTQLGKQSRIFARGGGQGRIKRASFVCHGIHG